MNLLSTPMSRQMPLGGQCVSACMILSEMVSEIIFQNGLKC